MTSQTWNLDASKLVQELVPVLTIWREASGEGLLGMAAVAWVIHNRSLKRKLTPSQVCLQPWQFSSMNAAKDPGMTHYPLPQDTSFESAYNVWEAVQSGVFGVDPTDGADFYFNPAEVLPKWAEVYTQTAVIGHHVFYRSSK